MDLFVYFGLLTTVVVLAAGWTPQLGTARYPKQPDITSHVRKGDIFVDKHENYYRARKDHLNPQNLRDTDWQKLKKGTFILPKYTDTDALIEEDDIFEDLVTKKKYKATRNGYVDSTYNDEGLWEELKVGECWMEQLYPIIRDRRLSDLIIPGSHDAATDGINEDHYLVDQNFFFRVASQVAPGTVANWSLTQEHSVGEQLAIGFRLFDLRIADVEIFNDTFRWWHGVTGNTVFQDLDDIAWFAESHPEEVIILEFGHFAMPGNALSPTRPIPNHRKDELSNILLGTLGDDLVPDILGSNPTISDILGTGHNVIAIMKDAYIRNKDERYWPSIIHSAWTGRAETEALFEERSNKLIEYKQNYQNQLTYVSGACTPNEKTVVAGLVNRWGDNDDIRDIIDQIAPNVTVVPENMSFEGLWMDLLYMARNGVNRNGMLARNQSLYTNGQSVHYKAVNDFLRYWAARPDKFKLNFIGVDDTTGSSNIVETAILANSDEIPREVAVTYQGNTRDGYFTWDGFKTTGGPDGFECSDIQVRYIIETHDPSVNTKHVNITMEAPEITFAEGEYPEDSMVVVEVSTDGDEWVELFDDNINRMIVTNRDVYIRGSAIDENSGFAYISETYNIFGDDCTTPPADGYINIVFW